VKADAKFTYSEAGWRPIALEIGRVFTVPPSAPKSAIDHFYQWAGDILERLAQEYVAKPIPPRLPPVSPISRAEGEGMMPRWWATRQKFLERMRNEVVTFRRSVVESRELHSSLRSKADAVLSEIDRDLADEINTAELCYELGTAVREANRKRPPRSNARKGDLDVYFSALTKFWMRIGGAKKPPGRKTTALLISFIQAAASPVVTDKKSVSHTAIAARLRRLESNK
jgi:hypothetical protein